jgi:hypothetical protein
VFVVMKDLAQAERMKEWMEAHFVRNEDSLPGSANWTWPGHG